MDITRAHAQALDAADPLASYREQFYIPQHEGQDAVYLCGNSLGLQPKRTADYLEQELADWKQYGVEGHFHAQHPWMPYHEFLTEQMAKVVGGKPHEVVVMNSLTANLHFMMVSFYRPQAGRFKILMDYSPFPSDRYALESQVKFHGYEPSEAIIELQPEPGTEIVSMEAIQATLDASGDEIALVMIGGVNYYTGQYYDVEAITAAGHAKGCVVGFDMAHGAGNVPLQLHDHGVDFAVWCTYKYLNSGPGSLSGCFVHERHAERPDLPRFAGWWGHDKETRFLMEDDFVPMRGAEGWQLSNPPILSMAAIRASLDVIGEAGFEQMVAKSQQLTQYTIDLLDTIDTDRIAVITPRNAARRGCQLSLQVRGADKSLFDEISRRGVVADWREPDVIRIAPVPLYNSYEDVWRFVDILRASL